MYAVGWRAYGVSIHVNWLYMYLAIYVGVAVACVSSCVAFASI